MERNINNEIKDELENMIIKIHDLIDNREFHKCDELLRTIMAQYPHEPHPHNLYGIFLEKQGKHADAMKHFRAAWSLDPTYLPARYNMENYGGFSTKRKPAYNEEDCPEFQ